MDYIWAYFESLGHFLNIQFKDTLVILSHRDIFVIFYFKIALND